MSELKLHSRIYLLHNVIYKYTFIDKYHTVKNWIESQIDHSIAREKKLNDLVILRMRS